MGFFPENDETDPRSRRLRGLPRQRYMTVLWLHNADIKCPSKWSIKIISLSGVSTKNEMNGETLWQSVYARQEPKQQSLKPSPSALQWLFPTNVDVVPARRVFHWVPTNVRHQPSRQQKSQQQPSCADRIRHSNLIQREMDVKKTGEPFNEPNGRSLVAEWQDDSIKELGPSWHMSLCEIGCRCKESALCDGVE